MILKKSLMDRNSVDADTVQNIDISHCLVHRTRNHMTICLNNEKHCIFATPFGNECKHPLVDQIREGVISKELASSEKLSELSKRIFELLATSDITNLDVLLERISSILRDSNELPVDSRGAIVLINPRKYYFQVAQYGMKSPNKTDFRWHHLFFENATILQGSVIRASELNDSIIGGRRQSLLLPLLVEDKFIGYAVLFAAPAYQPTLGHLDFFAGLARGIASVVQRVVTHETLQIRDLELEESRMEIFNGLGRASHYRDDDTGWHVMRMTHFAVSIAKAYGLPEQQREVLSLVAPMHDVGKIGIPDAILLKPGKLNEEEFATVKEHTTIGATILDGKDPLLTAAREVALSHHERWDGMGYPHGLAKEQIPLLARICAVADVFDALLSSRTYKDAWTVEVATDWIVSQSGKLFEPAIVSAFQAALPEIIRIRELYRDDIIDPRESIALLPLPPRTNAWVEWDDKLSVGIDAIDEHHRYLLDLINDLFEVVNNKRGARAIAKVLNATEAYARVHFRTEELMMQHYGYDGLHRQEQQHHAFETQIREFYDELHENPLVAQFDILSYLRDWLIHHISIDDAGLHSLTAT